MFQRGQPFSASGMLSFADVSSEKTPTRHVVAVLDGRCSSDHASAVDADHDDRQSRQVLDDSLSGWSKKQAGELECARADVDDQLAHEAWDNDAVPVAGEANPEVLHIGNTDRCTVYFVLHTARARDDALGQVVNNWHGNTPSIRRPIVQQILCK